MGKWKGIRKDIKKGNLKIELYDLEKDPKELIDVSEQYPQIVQKIEEIMKKNTRRLKIRRFAWQRWIRFHKRK